MKVTNRLRYFADQSHLISTIILIHKMCTTNSCYGLSLKAQIMFLISYFCRLSVFTTSDPTLYDNFSKFFYFLMTLIIVYLIGVKYSSSYQKKYDTFNVFIILLICFPLSYISTPNHTASMLLYYFSLWLESFAILPQIILISRVRRIEVLANEYIFFMGLYRVLYLINWINQSLRSQGVSWIIWTNSFIQAVLHIDFIYYFIKSVCEGREFALPL